MVESSTVNKQVHSFTFRVFAMRMKALATIPAKSAVRLTQLLSPLQTCSQTGPPGSLLQRFYDGLFNQSPHCNYYVVSSRVFNVTSRFPFFDAIDPQQMEVYWFILVYSHARKVTSLFSLYGTMTRGRLSVQNQRTLFPEPRLSLVKSVLWFFRSDHLFPPNITTLRGSVKAIMTYFYFEIGISDLDVQAHRSRCHHGGQHVVLR
jgi:hypothetical protein